jgi:hypothetical protein
LVYHLADAAVEALDHAVGLRASGRAQAMLDALAKKWGQV